MAYSHVLDALNKLTGNTTPANSTIDVNGVSLDIEFQEYSTAQTISADTNLGSATADTKNCFVTYDSDLTVDAAKTLSTSVRKRGLFILVKGNLVVNGIITQTARGASAIGQALKIITASTYDVPATGAAGGASGGDANGTVGTAASGVQTGGGGGGGSEGGSGTTYGGDGTSYSGGTGGGAQGGTNDSTPNGSDTGGAGGTYASPYGLIGTANIFGGGTGNPGGTGGNVNGNDGTGGLVVIFVFGNVTYGASSVISSNGVSSPNITGGVNRNEGGGASGGGIAMVLYRGGITNSGLTLTATGGAHGTVADGTHGDFYGGDGGAGYTTNSQNALTLPVLFNPSRFINQAVKRSNFY